MPATATVAAGLVVPLVLAGELRGALFEGTCELPGAEVRLTELPRVAPGPIRPIVLSTGDLLGPEPLSGYALDGPRRVQADVIEIFFGVDGRPVFDAVLPGNFELSAPRRRLQRLGASEALPLTVANVELDARARSPTPRRPGAAVPPVETPLTARRHRVFVRGGARVGVTAVLDESLGPSIDPRRSIRIQGAAPALDEALEVLRKAGVGPVVALMHVRRADGLGHIVRILEALRGRPPDIVLTSPIEGDPSLVRLEGLGTVVVSAPPVPTEAALVEMTLDRSGRVASVDARRRPVPSVPSGKADVVRNWACRQLDVPLEYAPLEGPVSREAFVQFALERMRRVAGAEIAFLGRGSLGPDGAFPLVKSPTRLDIRRALPFDEGLEVLEIRGANLLALERLATDPRIASLGLRPNFVAGRPRDPLRVYRVVTVDFLAEGGDQILDPNVFRFSPILPGRSLRDIVIEGIQAQGFETGPAVLREPGLLDFRVNVGAAFKSVNVENRAGAEAPQLTRRNFLGLSGDLELRLAVDLPEHRLELNERTRYGVVREEGSDGGGLETRENEDVTVVELLYSGRLARGPDRPWIPDAGASARFETELTIPEERDYRRALLQAGVGPAWRLTNRLTFRSQLGLRRELLASARSQDPAEAALADTRLAILSTGELRDEVFRSLGPRPIVLNVRVDHTADVTGRVRDQVVQGRIALDVPVVDGLALTAAIDVYILERAAEGGRVFSGGALDTSFGIKTTADFSQALF